MTHQMFIIVLVLVQPWLSSALQLSGLQPELDVDVRQSIPDVNLTWLRDHISLGWEKLNTEIDKTLQAVEWSNSYNANNRSDLRKDVPLRIGEFNAERGLKWREACELMKQHEKLSQTSIWILNEMDYGMARTSNEHTTQLLANCLGMNYAYGVEFVELGNGLASESARVNKSGLSSSRGFHGNAILSKFPFEEVKVVRYQGAESHHFWFDVSASWGERRLGGRMALVGTVRRADGHLVDIVSTHLDNDRTKDWQGYNMDSLKSIGGSVNSEQEAPQVIIAGDLPNRQHMKDKVQRDPAIVQVLSDSFGYASPFNFNQPRFYENPGHYKTVYPRDNWFLVKGMSASHGVAEIFSSHGTSDHPFLSLVVTL